MKRILTALTAVITVVLLSSVLCFADEPNTDTLSDWNIRIVVPDGAKAVMDGSDGCYYLYAEEEGSIPYVMLYAYEFDSEEAFFPAFTEYMKGQVPDLKVTSEPVQKMIGNKLCWETDYGYKISGYDVRDRRIAITVGDTTYMFASKEVEELHKTVGTMLEDVVADCVFLTDDGEELDPDKQDDVLAEAYLYRQDDGMPKYWLDLTGMLADGPVLHCYFRSGDPTFYESNFLLDMNTADIRDDRIEIRTVKDDHGLDRSKWFRSLTITMEDDKLVMDVKRDEKTLAGGSDDNILTGSYPMEPMGAGVVYEYHQDDGQLKYWLDREGEDVVLHAMFRSGDPEYYEETFKLDTDTAEQDDYTIVIHKVLNSRGEDVSKWFRSFKFTEVEGAVNMVVERDEKTLAGGADDNILTGTYLMEPRTYLKAVESETYKPKELGELAQLYYFRSSGYYPPKADVTENKDGTFTIHLYEVVEQDGDTHTATSAWYTVDKAGAGTDDITGKKVDLAG